MNSFTSSHAEISPRVPPDILEQRAAQQRQKLHESVTELREKMREELDLENQVRRHVWPTTGIVTLTAMLVGYAIASMIDGPA